MKYTDLYESNLRIIPRRSPEAQALKLMGRKFCQIFLGSCRGTAPSQLVSPKNLSIINDQVVGTITQSLGHALECGCLGAKMRGT